MPEQSGAHSRDCASRERLPDPGPENEGGTFDERGWYHPPCDCSGATAFEKGQRVVISRNHVGHPGEHGEIVTRAASLFNGWTIRLDSGTLCGVAEWQMRPETEAERGY